MYRKLSVQYYSPKGYWKGIAVKKKLAEASNVSEDVAGAGLKKQFIWQIYLPVPGYIPRPKFDVSMPNETHQADLLFLPHDRLPRGRKAFKFFLTFADVANHYNEREPLTSKDLAEVASALLRNYKEGSQQRPKLL